MSESDSKPRDPHHAVLISLRSTFPVFQECRPLAIGIHKAVLERIPSINPQQLRLAMRMHTASARYLKALTNGETRFDLDGNPAGAVTPEQKQQALDTLRDHLAEISVPESPTLVEIESARGSLQLIAHDIGRATASVRLLAPADAYHVLTPSLRKAAGSGVTLDLCALEPVELPFATVRPAHPGHQWPGQPLVAVVDDRSAVMAARVGTDVRGHWSTAPAFVAAAALAFERFGTAP